MTSWIHNTIWKGVSAMFKITLTEANAFYWIAGMFALLELFRWLWTLGQWFASQFGMETKTMKAQRENRERLVNAENDIKEIRETAKHNVETFLEHERVMNDNFIAIKDELLEGMEKLHNKIDEHGERLEDIDADGKRRDCSIFRDRIIQSTRYFNQQRSEDGFVYLSISDFENLQNLFAEYFAADGNGVVHQIYEQDFLKTFKVDNTSLNIRR